MSKKSKQVSRIVLVAGILVLGLTVICADALELKFATTGNPKDPLHMCCYKFADLVKEKTGGAITITIYPGGQLGGDPQILQGVRLGSIDFAMTGAPWHTSFAPWLGILNLPFLFRDRDHAYRVLDGPIGRDLFNPLEKLGIKALGTMELGFRQLTNSKGPVSKPQDVKGLKLRTTGDSSHVRAWKLLGAIPTPMPFPELYMALQTGTVDGQENPLNVIYGVKLFEVQKYMSFTGHAYTTALLDMNLKKYESLPSSQQEILFEALREAEDWHRSLNRENDERWLKEMKEFGMIIEENPDRDAFSKVVKKALQEEYAKNFGWTMIDRVNQTK